MSVVLCNERGNCGNEHEWTEPTVSDNCSAITTSIEVTGDYTALPSLTISAMGGANHFGDYFAVGNTWITMIFEDANGNSASCSFTVTVNDCEPPSFNQACPEDNGPFCNDAGKCSARLTPDAVDADDNCVMLTMTYDLVLPDGSTDTGAGNVGPYVFPVGTTVITYTAVDSAGNTATCVHSMSITDCEVPTITCPAPITRTLDDNCCYAVEDFTASPTTTDNCMVTVTQEPLVGMSLCGVGVYGITLTATDPGGNTAMCMMELNLIDVTPPAITCPCSDDACRGR